MYFWQKRNIVHLQLRGDKRLCVYCACETFLHPASLDAAVQLTLQVLRRVILTALFGPTLYEAVQVGNIRKRQVDRFHSRTPYIDSVPWLVWYDGLQRTALKREFCIRTIFYVCNASSACKIVNRTHGALSVTWNCSQSFVIALRKRVLLKSSLLLLDRYTLLVLSSKYTTKVYVIREPVTIVDDTHAEGASAVVNSTRHVWNCNVMHLHFAYVSLTWGSFAMGFFFSFGTILLDRARTHVTFNLDVAIIICIHIFVPRFVTLSNTSTFYAFRTFR